jgi:Flp pilus assembly protein TadG
MESTGNRNSWRKAIRGFRRSGTGSVALEYGIAVLVLLSLLLGIVDMGRLLWTFATLSRAAEAAARCGVVNTVACGTSAQIQQNAVAQAWGLPVTSSVFSVSNPSCGMSVSASYTFTFFTPGFGTVTLNPSACFPQ